SVGDAGFAPTAVAVHPHTGDLFVAIGGRGTRGAVYRIHYTNGPTAILPEAVAALQPAARSLDWRPELAKELTVKARDANALERLRALIALRRHGEHVTTEMIEDAIRANGDHADRYVRQATAAL